MKKSQKDDLDNFNAAICTLKKCAKQYVKFQI